jgi:hypothetical protein
MKKEDINNIFIILIGIILILTVIDRIFSKEERYDELKDISLPKGFDIVIILVEFIIGIILISNCFTLSFKYTVLKILFAFILLGCILIFIHNYNKIIYEIDKIFIFKPTAMSLGMHFLILFSILILIVNK